MILATNTTAADSTASAHKIAESIATLPPLPATAQNILTCFGDEYIDADEVAGVVDGDPGICARLLGLANSAYFGLAQPVTNIRDAISRVLGVDTVRSLVLAMAIQSSFNSKSCPAFCADRFWTQSLLTAECCKLIAMADKVASAAERDLAYSTGLCHNLGLMALAHMEPAVTHNVLRTNGEDPRPGGLVDLFLAELGTDHRVMTAELARYWAMPNLMVVAYECRAYPDSDCNERIGLIVAAGAAGVGNTELEEDRQLNLNGWTEGLGLAAEDLQQMANFSDRKKERVRSLSSNMTG